MSHVYANYYTVINSRSDESEVIDMSIESVADLYAVPDTEILCQEENLIIAETRSVGIQTSPQLKEDVGVINNSNSVNRTPKKPRTPTGKL